MLGLRNCLTIMKKNQSEICCIDEMKICSNIIGPNRVKKIPYFLRTDNGKNNLRLLDLNQLLNTFRYAIHKSKRKYMTDFVILRTKP